MTKKQNKRFARKRALRTTSLTTTRDTIRASRRKWGMGQGA